jgi:DNA repair protein RecO (recombination protein O)
MTRRYGAAAPVAAYVLHRYDWSESSLILDLFTRDQGRLAVVAKGAKRPYSQLRSVLLPFQKINIVLGKAPKNHEGDSDIAPHEVQTLRGAEWAGGMAMLTGSGLFSGFYLNELLMKLLARQDPHLALFDAYAATLPSLSLTEEKKVQAALRAFELTLLKQLGLLPDLSLHTTTQQPLQTHLHYNVQPEAGVSPSGTNELGLSGEALTHLQAALLHGSLPALQQQCETTLGPLRTSLRGLLHYHLGYNILRTRQVMLGVQILGNL